MKIVAKALLFIALLTGFNLGMSYSASAQNEFSGCFDSSGNLKAQFKNSPLCQDLADDQDTSNNRLYGPGGLVTRIADLLSIVVGVAAVIMIIIGGTRYVLSSGDAKNLEGAKNTIIFALVGLGVAIFAQLIVVFVVRRL